MSARRARYRSIRLVVLGAGLLVGIGYPLVLALGGSVLVELHSARHGTTISVHNARPWLVVAAVAAVLILVELTTPARRTGAAGKASGPAAGEAAGKAAGEAPPSPDTGSDAPTPGGLRRRLEALEAARRSEREWNAALDIRLAELSRGDPPRVPSRAVVADVVLELTMELFDAPAGLLALRGSAHSAAVAARGVAEPDAVAAALAPPPAPGVGERRHGPESEWLVLGLGAGEHAAADGILALGGRPDGFAGLDDGVLGAVARRAAILLAAGDPR